MTQAAIGADLPIAVIIPTRNRGTAAADAARAVLMGVGRFQLIVVDQSTNDDTFQALAAIDDHRLSVVRSELTGISNARNLGVRVTTAPILAFTDDDCRPEPGWVLQMLARFQEDPSVSLVFGRVTLPPAGPDDYAPSFTPQERFQEGRAPLPDEDIGIGASFAIRRTTLDALGGFDPLLGQERHSFAVRRKRTFSSVRWRPVTVFSMTPPAPFSMSDYEPARTFAHYMSHTKCRSARHLVSTLACSAGLVFGTVRDGCASTPHWCSETSRPHGILVSASSTTS